MIKKNNTLNNINHIVDLNDIDNFDALVKRIFCIVCVVLIIVLFIKSVGYLKDKKEYEHFAALAFGENTSRYCENIKNLQFSSLCYSEFIVHGFDCRSQENSSDACMLAQAVFLQDDLFCDAVFTGTKVPENLECRVSVFIERYTHEGLSDCCHIK